tara:strand:- start:710 stop:916 length:207 start_codon:yes stop_codon:yes gene_type:complete
MKRFITSSRPRIAKTGDYIQIVRKKVRQPVKTWKTVLKEQGKNRTVKVQERAKPIPAEMVEWLQRLTG